MSKNRENVIWQGSNGKWNRGFFDFVVTGPDDEWDVEYDNHRFFWTATGLPSEDAARQAWEGANPGGYRRMLWSNKADRPYIERYEKMASESKPSRSPRRRSHATARKLDEDLIDHACSQLAKAARKHVRGGMGPASAASAAIRETRTLFPADWRLAVQGDDSDASVEVWEVEHKRTFPCAQISRELETKPLKAREIRARLKARGYRVSTSGRAGIRGPWEAWAVHRDLPVLSTGGHASQIDALRALFEEASH